MFSVFLGLQILVLRSQRSQSRVSTPVPTKFHQELWDPAGGGCSITRLSSPSVPRDHCWELGALLPQEPGARFSSRVVLFYPPKCPCSGRVVLLQWTLDFLAGSCSAAVFEEFLLVECSQCSVPAVGFIARCCQRIQAVARRGSTNLVQRSSVAPEMITRLLYFFHLVSGF